MDNKFKIALIMWSDFSNCPYSRKYIEILEKKGAKLDIILWHRNIDENNKSFYCNNIYEYNGILKKHNRLEKIKHIFKYKKFICELINKNKYDKIIVLTTLPAILIRKILYKNYKKNYIFDYRDVTYENFFLYKKTVKKLIKNSYMTAVSSCGFKKIIGEQDNVCLAHNFNYFDINNKIEYKKITNKECINIVYIGMIREIKMMKRLMDIFGNDKRFNIIIHGDGCVFQSAKLYAKKFNNIVMTGKYNYFQKPNLLKDADLLAYFYPESYVNHYAIANKFYDGLIYKIPTIGNISTYSGQKILKKGVGCSIDFNEDIEKIKNQVYLYFNSIDEVEFNKKTNEYLNEIINDDFIYLNKIKKFLNRE